MSETYKISIEDRTKWVAYWVDEETLKKILNLLDINLPQAYHSEKTNIKQTALDKFNLK
jgi:hypothetical protein